MAFKALYKKGKVKKGDTITFNTGRKPISQKAVTNYSMTVRDGKLILIPQEKVNHG